MKYAFIKENKNIFSINVMCKVLNVSRSGFYQWLNGALSRRKASNIKLGKTISQIHSEHKGKYGYIRITKQLKNTGISCSKNRVYNIMKNLELKYKSKKKFKVTTDSNHKLPVYNNIIARDFSTTDINQKWFSDITYMHTNEGWLYLAVVIDVYSRAVIGRSMNRRMTQDLVCNALNMALWRRKFSADIIVHSDRGSQYCSKKYQAMLKNYHLICSMSRKGDCWDNAIAETFFHTLKVELIYDHKYKLINEAKNSIFKYIETYYNKKKLHSSIGYLAPINYEAKSTQMVVY